MSCRHSMMISHCLWQLGDLGGAVSSPESPGQSPVGVHEENPPEPQKIQQFVTVKMGLNQNKINGNRHNNVGTLFVLKNFSHRIDKRFYVILQY